MGIFTDYCALCGKKDFKANLEGPQRDIYECGRLLTYDCDPMYYHEECRKREAGIQTCPRCNGTGECKKKETEETTDG